MEQYKDYKINNSTIKVLFGNILDSRAEVIVNSSGSKMTMSGGLTKAIREAGGEVIREDAQTKLPVNVGDAVVTTAGRLHQKYIFHCITIDRSIDHSNTPKGISDDDIHQYIIGHSIDKCFQLLQALELTSIAFPAIGAGAAAIPFEKVSKVMSEAIARNLRKTNKPILVEIYLFDRFRQMKEWDYLPMFEQFSAQEALSKLLLDQSFDRLNIDENHSQIINYSIPDIDREVFISYSRKDIDVVKPIYEKLETAGVKCWLDVDGMYSGVSFKTVVVSAIKRAKVVMFMSSENSNKSQNVISEVSLANKYKKKIIPIRLDMTSYHDTIEYDIINHDYVVYDRLHKENSFNDLLKKTVSTLKMVNSK